MDKLIGLDLINFQSHKDTKLAIAPGYTVIVGASDVGKSAVIRALKMLVRNGAASGLVKQGAKSFEITARFADGQKESVIKGDRKSEFYLNDDLFAKAGVAPIDAITDLWALPQPDGRELCLTSQHDTPFLLAEPASAVAKVLGELTNAAMLMKAVQEANRLRLQATQEEQARTREASELMAELQTHSTFPKRLKATKAARELVDQLLLIQAKHDRMAKLCSELEKCKSELENLSADVGSFDAVEHAVQAAESAVERLERLKGLLVQLEQAQIGVVRAREIELRNEAQALHAEDEAHRLLEENGQCPLCGQGVK